MKPHKVLLLWDAGEGADLYALTVTPKEFKELKSLNDLFCNADLPEDLEPAWDRLNAALSDNPDHVPDHAKDCVGKWTDCKCEAGSVIKMNGDWAVVSTGMAL